MRKWLLCLGCFICLVIPFCLFAARQEVHRSIEEMLSYHVEYKEFSPMLAKRSFKIFFDQFDPHKVYLLQDEVVVFTEMTEKEARAVSVAHYKGEYPLYEKADRQIRYSIERARDCRKKIKNKFLQEGVTYPTVELGSSFAKSLDLLESRMQKQMALLIQVEQEVEGIKTLSTEDLEKVLTFIEKRFIQNEEAYLTAQGESALSLRILKAFAKSLDAHTSFFSREEAFELRANLEKQFEGIGIVVREGVYGIRVKEVLSGGPAEKSGLLAPGDLLLSVNGKDVSSASYVEVMEWLKGDRHSLVKIVVQKTTGEVVSLALAKETMKVEKEMIHHSFVPFGDGIIGILEVPSFYESSCGFSCEKDIKEALRVLKTRGDLRGVVLDMRRNSGGFLSQAVKVAGLFVSSGVIVISKYSNGQMQYLREIDGRVYYEGPLVVLTSKMSASAAEIVAQALQDYGLALVVGDERTYGKGTIQYQTVTDEDASSYFKVTVGRYYTVSGKSTQIEGVKADIVVPTAYSPFHIGEKYLPYALKNDQVSSAFSDSLEGVDASKKAWFRKNYLPHIQKRLSFWTEMLPVLKANSDSRLKNNKNFLCFLDMLGKENFSPNGFDLAVGLEDLQVSEVVNVLKDMALLEKYNKNRSIKRK